MKHILAAIAFLTAWVVAGSSMHLIGVDDNWLYMFVGNLFGMGWMAYLLFASE